MADYDYRCEAHGVTTVTMPMSSVTATSPCPECGGDARRVYTAPQIRTGNSTARTLIDATKRTASEPAVVSAPPGPRPGRRRPRADPRTAKLPAP